MTTLHLTDYASMLAYGNTLAKQWSHFLLYGDLGAWKTTLTKGIATWLWINADSVQSPTYTYIHMYEEKLLHIDMRRIEDEKQLHTLWLLDLIEQYPYVIIERPKREKNYADTSWQQVTIEQHEPWRVCTQKYWWA
jgi:tRNA threonylcarbamoyladenosine biosynthesis protein TsaE